MARRKTTIAPVGDVRAFLIDRYHRLAGVYRGVPGAESYWGGRAKRLEAGDPIAVYAHELPRWLPDRPRHGRWNVDRHGALAPAEREQER